jgi:hypothetical protein
MFVDKKTLNSAKLELLFFSLSLYIPKKEILQIMPMYKQQTVTVSTSADVSMTTTTKSGIRETMAEA